MDHKRQHRLQHTIFEMGLYLGNQLVSLFKRDEKLHEHLLDSVGGTDGLFTNFAFRWAMEFEEKYPHGSEFFLDEIDTFTSEKLDRLVKTASAGRLVSIQVVPTAHHGSIANVQLNGPDKDTTHWGVYERTGDGAVRWVADLIDESLAMRLGAMLAAQHGVEIEPQPWKEKTAPTGPAGCDERFHVTWTIDIDATSARAAAQQARAIQLRPDSIATVFDVRDDNSDVSVRIDLGESA